MTYNDLMFRACIIYIYMGPDAGKVLKCLKMKCQVTHFK